MLNNLGYYFDEWAKKGLFSPAYQYEFGNNENLIASKRLK
jgi:hypothetical protein